MDFFAHQDDARRKTSALVAYYFLAVFLIMISVYLVFAAVFIGANTATSQDRAIDFSKLWNPELFMYVIGGTLLVVILGSLFKISQLGQGGKSIAEMLGGRLISSNAKNNNERKILNIVEEMAIASGTPVPPVYIMEGEQGINAFAAGFSPSDAVIGVTKGCIEELSRDELQGVIAHEFSHIMNGDMRLNIRLMGVLHGILVIALLGFWIMRISAHSSGRSREKGGAGGAIILGIGLMIVGYIGVFFGKLIKSAVSRQREYLADASAVQFTRNPDGISGALKKIGGFNSGSRLQSAHAEEASHFFFCDGLKSSFMNSMSTHPPLSERIKRIDPAFSGNFKAGTPSSHKKSTAGISGFAADEPRVYAIEPDEVVSTIGAPKQEHINHAVSLISAIPDNITQAAREPYGARAIIYCLLLNKETQPRTYQLKRLAEHADPAVYTETIKLMSETSTIDPETRLPLIDIAIGSLKQLSETQYRAFSANIDHLMRADEHIDLFEYTIQKMISRNLDPVFSSPKPAAIQYYDLQAIKSSCTNLLSCLAHWGGNNSEEAEKAFAAGTSKLNITPSPSILTRDSCGLSTVDDALNKINESSPMLKKIVINAAVSCVGADGKVTIEEAELLRAISDSLGCPMPPFLQTNKAA